jgi:hypothetical protein
MPLQSALKPRLEQNNAHFLADHPTSDRRGRMVGFRDFECLFTNSHVFLHKV